MIKEVWARRVELMSLWLIGCVEDEIKVAMYKADESEGEFKVLYLEHVVFLRKQVLELDVVVRRCRNPTKYKPV